MYQFIYLSLLIYSFVYPIPSRWDDFLRCRQDLLEATHKGPVKAEVTQWVMRESDINGNGLLSRGHQLEESPRIWSGETCHF